MAHISPSLFLINICIILISTCHATKLPKFSSILIFGDSLLDTGNNNFISTMVRADHPPYGRSFPGAIPTGRFSDGKLMSDLLADALGIKETVPPYLRTNLSDDDIRTGVCFASAGSGYDDATTVVSRVIPVSKQYGTYFSEYAKRLVGVVGKKEARNILNSSFVFVTSGSNDMAINFYSGSAWGLQFTLDGYQNYLLERIKKFIKALYDAGCRNMAIAGLPPLGCGFLNFRSIQLPTACFDDKNSDSQVYNNKLIAMLAQQQASLPGSKLVYADLFEPLKDMYLNPYKYGFLVSVKGCCGMGFVEFGLACNLFTPTCPNPSQFLLWDSVHPTETAYRILSQYYVDTLLPQFL